MRRFAVFLLLVALPLQYSWAAVGAYCQHEGSAAQWHFGHHVHKHDQGDQKPGMHADCAACQHVNATMPAHSSPTVHTAPAVHVPFDPQHWVTGISSEPEKPNWASAA